MLFFENDCFTDYTGNINVTIQGRACLAWTTVAAYYPFCVNDKMFPDGSVDAAANFCRDPFRSGHLWCFVSDSYILMEKCLPESCEVKVCSIPSCANGGRRTSLWNECICKCAEGFGGDSCDIDHCGQHLGLTDNYASVLGLNSSSEDSTNSLSRIGLYDTGWCALPGDLNPFVQVDLLIEMIVEGLLVQNRLLFTYEVGKLRNIYQAGVKTFYVSYGNDIEVLQRYKDDNGTHEKIFSLPDSEATTTILFHRPFVSRYVRIYLVSAWERPCMRLDIIGCIKSVDYWCKPDSVHIGWSSNAEGFLRASKLDITDIRSSEACTVEVDTRHAVAFKYVNETQQCIILVDSLTSLTWIQKQDYMIRICADVVNSLEKRIVSPIDGHTIFTSYGYPFTYNKYGTMIWIVETDINNFPDIYFIHISLDVGDTIHMTETSNTYLYQRIINSSLNGNQVRQVAYFHSIKIIFGINSFENIIKRKGSGFIAVVTSSNHNTPRGSGFPNKLLRWDCALLNGENFDQKAHVENTLCNTRVTEMFICEINSSNANAAQGKRQCLNNAFQCSDGTCISASQFCDHIKDCKDSSDEYCESRTCEANEFQCNNGQCILKQQLCNAERNCLDESDEKICRNCYDEGITTFRCADFTCIHFERVCDGFYDCPDMDDEKNCAIKALSCKDWWENGKRVMGVYTLYITNSSSEINVVCNFNHINEKLLISTVYNADYVRASAAALEYGKDGDLKYNYKLIYPSDKPEILRYRVNEGRICTQSIRLDCTDTKQKITDIVGNSAFPECICTNWTASTIIESGGINIITNYQWAIIYFSINSTYKQQRVTVGPLVCKETFYPDDAKIPCDKGHPVSKTTRCLCDENWFGLPVGCVDMSHTKDCETFICPDNFVKCPGSFCLAVRLLCDSVQQCPNGEDEADCGYRGIDCPGHLRCNQSNICIPPSQVCDGFKHCPAGDDEIFCNISCPGACICQGTFVDCSDGRINATDIVLLSKESRKIILSNSTIGKIIVPFILPMAFLANLSDSGIEEIQPGLFESMKNLRTLDISYNTLRVLHKNTFKGLVNLQELVIGNNIYLTTIERGAFQDLENISEIYLTHLHISFLGSDTFEGLSKLKKIDLRFSKLSHVENRAFYGLDKLESLIISYNKIKVFDSEIFSGLTYLRYLETDEYELCCLKPSTVGEANCHLSQAVEFYSCEDLVRNVSLRVLLWIIGLLSLVGNLASFIYRKWKLGLQLKMGYGIFVTNLIVADALMGIYLLIMAFADTYYRKTSATSNTCEQSREYCRAAGVVSTLSSEASTFFVMLITLDRILVVKFPFGQVKMTPSTCKVASFLAWLTAITLSVVPIGMNMYFNGKFYSRTFVWFVLPLTRDNAPGWEYLFAIFITLNFVLVLLIAIGQVLIFKAMRTKSPVLYRQKRSRDQTLAVARNLLLVVFANFLGWFPIGVIGILTLMTYTIPLDVYSWASVVILPLNSVLNPILYTLSAVIKREKFVPASCEQDIISKEDIRRLDELFSYDVLYANDVRKLTCASTCIENHTLSLNQIDLVTRKIAERFDFLHRRMLYYGNLTMDNIWIFLDNDDVKGVWLQGKPKRAVNKQMQSSDIQFLDSIREKCLTSGGHIVHEIEEQ
ncbi:hypothetical protein ACJMK2_002064 [Sinanodonta woodiana]|uniref:G-protein coupled receptor GRL101 n=1 Tax=Sinanodonta woodiana TaxID=1069815 RepID=A0ABD3XXF6_SINWO